MSGTRTVTELRVVRDGVDIPDIHRLDVYTANGGYESLKRAVKSIAPDKVIEMVGASGLTGRGGADFPTGRKWRTVADSAGVPYVVCNGKESEPGAFKDKEMMEQMPHRLLEGALIAAHAVAADEVIFFIREGYPLACERVEAAIREAEAAGIIGDLIKVHAHVHVSPEAYICGEETALIEALEGNRPMPRGKPPYPAVSGFNSRPTMVNNVETLCNIPIIVEHGPEWFMALGVPGASGTRLFSMSGHIEKPGTYECELGVPMSGLIELAGGLRPGHSLKAFIPGGTSTPILPPAHVNVAMDPASLKKAGSLLGTASVIIYDDTVCMVDAVANLVQFYRDESCGKCTPCRDGTELLYQLLIRIERGEGTGADIGLIRRISDYIPVGSVCGLGVAAPVPAVSAMRHFMSEFDEHIRLGYCPVRPQYEVRGQAFPVLLPPGHG
jgi:NADH-quinone oxidoreductase subunit F